MIRYRNYTVKLNIKINNTFKLLILKLSKEVYGTDCVRLDIII